MENNENGITPLSVDPSKLPWRREDFESWTSRLIGIGFRLLAAYQSINEYGEDFNTPFYRHTVLLDRDGCFYSLDDRRQFPIPSAVTESEAHRIFMTAREYDDFWWITLGEAFPDWKPTKSDLRKLSA